MILERFFPDLYIQSIYDLPLAELKEMGIRGLVFDIDNTVAPFDVADPDEKLTFLPSCRKWVSVCASCPTTTRNGCIDSISP